MRKTASRVSKGQRSHTLQTASDSHDGLANDLYEGVALHVCGRLSWVRLVVFLQTQGTLA